MTFDSVIFDMNSTLLNTLSGLGNACNAALRALGYPEHSALEIKNSTPRLSAASALPVPDSWGW